MKQLSLLIVLLVLTGCVSRTITEPSKEMGKNDEVVVDKKIVWFWQDDF